jgi:dTDP-4-dehydrorhamnose reductase
MRTLILGANGQLGRDLLKVFQAAGEVRGLDLPELDITDGAALTSAAEAFGPDLIINSAAYTDVDGAEDHLEAAFLVNETGARNAADAAARLNIPVVYYSTDFVFDGKSEVPYTPADPIAPLSVYGKSKATGEVAVRRGNSKHFILRTAWLYGPGGNNFVEKILRAAAARPSLRVVDDEIGSPTHTFDLAEATLALARTGAYGLYHVVNSGECSRYEQALDAIRLAGLNTPIEPCSADEFPAKAPRPRYSVLNTDALCTRIGRPMRPWQDALRHYMKRRGTPA